LSEEKLSAHAITLVPTLLMFGYDCTKSGRIYEEKGVIEPLFLQPSVPGIMGFPVK